MLVYEKVHDESSSRLKTTRTHFQLTINKCARVTDEMMYTLASTQRELESISIQECTAITRQVTSSNT